MKCLIFLCTILYSSTLISSENPEITYGTKSYIKFISKNIKHTANCTIDFWAFIPPEKRKINAQLAADSEPLVAADVYFPHWVLVKIDSIQTFKIYLIPQDTLIIKIDFAENNIAEALIFEGKNSLISKYYFEKYNYFGYRNSYQQAQLRGAKISLTQFSVKMDSLKKTELKFLQEFNRQHPLPDWFFNSEQWSILYESAKSMALAPYYRKDILKYDETIPDNYFSFWEKLPMLNPQAKYSSEYYLYLSSYFYYNILPEEYRWKDKMTFYQGMFKYYPQAAEKLLNQELRDIFLCYQLAEVINDGFLDFYDSQMQTDPLPFSYSNINNILDQYRKNKYAPVTGEKAFNFYLPDKNNTYYNLTDFKDTVVVLNFWFNGCVFCIPEMPYEKQLVKKYEHDAFKLINIHMKDNRKSWLQGLKRHQLAGINLFANTRWIELLRRNYAISGYPTYVIIAKDGTILNAKAIRPSRGLADEISKYLTGDLDQ
jgi:thiol-disulfide isomerase/thioredoxin